LSFANDLLAGRFQVVIFLTGVGARILFRAIETEYPRDAIVAALSQIITVVRGPKPASVLREFAVPLTITVPEPNTWRDLLKALTTIGRQSLGTPPHCGAWSLNPDFWRRSRARRALMK
jgi:uroporphyrinogen-III synthase